MSPDLLKLLYLLSAVLFILGIKGLTHPRTAVRGNLTSALGMFLATVATAWWIAASSGAGSATWVIILGGIILGSLIGWIFAVKVAMTAMPEMVALFNGFGGAASAFVAGVEVIPGSPVAHTAVTGATVALAGLIGSVTLTGSLVAFGKLYGIKWIPDGSLPGGKALNALLAVVAIVLCIVVTTGLGDVGGALAFWGMILVAGALGIGLVVAIGGADMPVVISLLNSYSGLAAAAAGFAIKNQLLVVAGALVGASGLILTKIMCKAMNRSLANVLFGGLGTGDSDQKDSGDDFYAGKVKATSAEEIAMLLDGVQRVVIVPGYGMAVAQAQHAVRDLANLLESRGATVEFGIHPVAGRMPGHMNVLLAEADVPYDKLKEMDEINPTFEQTDVTFVIGANDVVNPVARTDPNSPIAGMPILDVDKSRTVIVIKRSLSPGFAGIPNPLFIADNTLMYFEDGKKAIQDIIAALKESA